MAEAKLVTDGEDLKSDFSWIPAADADPTETAEWLDSLEYVLESRGPERVAFLIQTLRNRATQAGVELPSSSITPYVNTIPADQQPPYPGNREIERRIKSIIRWNAMAMVVRANKQFDGIGGHISTYASAATLYEVAFNHFFRGRGDDGYSGDQDLLSGARLPRHLRTGLPRGSFDRKEPGELPPRVATRARFVLVSPPLVHARFLGISHGIDGARSDHGDLPGAIQSLPGGPGHLKATEHGRVWCFLGDGECDEPETLGAITLASREQLDNLTFVINCNLQRLDGPGAGQRQDHPGTGRCLPRGRLECDQGHLGRRLG